jgi:hypothetical protein
MCWIFVVMGRCLNVSAVTCWLIGARDWLVSQFPTHLKPMLLGQVVKYYSKVQVKQILITLGGEFEHDNGKTILYRPLIVPLNDEDGESAYLLGAVNCKVKEE